MLVGTLNLFLSSSSDSFWIVAVCLVGAAIGTMLFFKGFRMLRYKRLILDTPLSRIHSASMGLVEVTGTPTGPKTLTAPVTLAPCYYYRVQAWEWQQSGNKHEWKRVLDESLCVPFFLEDGTGRMLINPQGAEMDVHRSFFDEIGSSFRSGRDLRYENARSFLVKRGLVSYEKIRIEERIVQPGFPLFVFGTLGENASRGTWDPQPQYAGGGASPFNIEFGSGPGLEIIFQGTTTGSQSGPLNNALLNVLTFHPGAQVTRLEMQHAPGSAPPALSAAAAEALQRFNASGPAGVPGDSPSAVAVINDSAPGSSSVPTFDLQPSAAVSKGQRGDPFTISWHSQKEVVQALAWKSLLYIWGGPVLAIVSLYFLLLFWKLNSSL